MSLIKTVVCTPEGERAWRADCFCGWSTASSKGHSKAAARVQVEALSSRHLAAHGAHKTWRFSQGQHVSVSGLPEHCLTSSQREELASLVADINPKIGTTKKPQRTPRFRDHLASFALLFLWLLATVGLLVLVEREDARPEPHPDPFMWLLLVVLLGGIVAIIRSFAGELGRWRRRLIDDFVAGLDVVEREPAAPERDDHVYKSTRQMQHEWYGEHRDLNWQDRVNAEMWGMDADTYKSNWLESE